MPQSIKKNFFYSAFLTTANYIFPLLTFPYVTRILGVNGIGICDFIDSIINYFILFSSMGIAIVGIREIASTKENHDALSKSFSGLVTINGLFTLISIVILAIITFTIPKLYVHRNLMLFGGFKIFFNFLLIEWYYKGLEEFRYITTRSLIIKTLYVLSVFLFVKTAEDYSTYYLLTVLMIGINAFINSFYAQRNIKFKLNLPQKTLITSLLIYGVYSILTSFYTTFNIAYLGFSTDITQVGYYTTATRLFNIIIALFSAFTSVMLPRMSSLIKYNKLTEFKILYTKSIDLLCSITIPSMFFAIIMAPTIIKIIAGDGFDGAILPMRIVMPLLFIIGYEQILIVQALMPLKKDKIVLTNSLCGAIFGILGNLILVKRLGACGSAIIWLIGEIIILILSQIAIKKELHESFPLKKLLLNLGVYSPIILLIFFSQFHLNSLSLLLITSIVFFMYCIVVNYLIFPNCTLSVLTKTSIKKIILHN